MEGLDDLRRLTRLEDDLIRLNLGGLILHNLDDLILHNLRDLILLSLRERSALLGLWELWARLRGRKFGVFGVWTHETLSLSSLPSSFSHSSPSRVFV